MRLHFHFSPGSGTCLWADDDASRARWTAAVPLDESGLPVELRRKAEELVARFDTSLDWNNPAAPGAWSPEEESQFEADAASWCGRARLALATSGHELVDSRISTSASIAADSRETPVALEGRVVACFVDAAHAATCAARVPADFTWHETTSFDAVNLPYRADGFRTPEDLLARLESEPGFVCGWWQTRDGGEDLMLAGDPVEHAIAGVRERNVTGLANFLAWLDVRRWHATWELAHEPWMPTRQHRLTDSRGTWREWWRFLRAAQQAVVGRRVSNRYREHERERLWFAWTNGGSRAGWPAHAAEAIERLGLRREAPTRWANEKS